MMVKKKMLKQLEVAKGNFKGERLRTVNEAYNIVNESKDLANLFKTSDKSEVNKLIRVVYHDANMSPKQRELRHTKVSS